MRYESFYPFAHQTAPSMRQQNVNRTSFLPPFQNQPSQANFSQQFQPFPNHIAEPPRGQEPSKLEGYMQTADRFLATAQQFAPLVQQFAPMMSNLPAMWRLYKGFQSMPSTSGPTAPSTRQAGPPPTASEFTREPPQNRPSIPRIFQPPNP